MRKKNKWLLLGFVASTILGNEVLTLNGYRIYGSEELYSEEPLKKEETRLTAVPYYTWGNRGANQMRVWLLEE